MSHSFVELLSGKCVCVRQGRSGSRGRRPFQLTEAEARYAPDLPFRMAHLVLDVSIDPVAQVVSGSVLYRLKIVDPTQATIVLDQDGIQIQAASIGGVSAEFRKEAQTLSVLIPDSFKPLKSGAEIELKIEFSAHRPRRGLYFTGPDENFPKKPYQVWSQGQDQDNHHWFPTFDYPNQRTTVEMIARVPEGFTAISNGALISNKGNQFHYKMGQPIVVYLITLVVGQFSGWKDKGPRGLPIEYFVVPGREEEGRRSFSRTPKMIEAFESKIGVPFPYEKYSQVAVQDFIFGGMENASATTQTDLTLHDTRAALDFSSDPLVSHELAHQWFGDLLTCRDWSHAWLNEGFATFLERVWVECDTGPNGGPDEAKYYAYIELKDYLSEDSGQYRRSIVCNTYAEPIDLFDRHLYQKGGLVLNLIRSVLGPDDFWKSIQHYVTRHQNQAVETLDLIRAIEEVTGRNLRRIFDEWVFSAGHPDFEVSYSWKEELKAAELVIEQKQTQGKRSVLDSGFVTPVFHVPVSVELWGENSQRVNFRVELNEARQRVLIPSAFQPKMVRFDPDFSVPKTLKFTRPRELLAYQLKNDPDCMGRIDAAKELAKNADFDAVNALAQAVQGDAFWGVQSEAALALSEIRIDAARDALIAALGQVKNSKARRGIVRALGTFKDQRAADALRKVAESDASYLVEAEATSAYANAALALLKSGEGARVDSVESFLVKQLDKPSYREYIRKSTFKALSQIPGVERGERPKALDAVLAGAKPGKSMDHRVGAILALGDIAQVAPPWVATRILGVLSEVAEEDSYFIRMMTVVALETANLPESVSILRRIERADADGRVKRHANWAVDAIMKAGASSEGFTQVKKDLDQLQADYQKLKTWVEELRVKTAVPPSNV